uniref:Nucleoporin NDC1 n=1 Tax=Angiostrongylus cantonensis TaxID=6313 RepID=A0A0K0DGV9_ANGCA
MKTVLSDLQIVVERHSDVLRNNALPFRFFISPIASVYGFLTLLPFQLFSIEVWRLITCSFVGNNVLIFAWTLWSLHFGTNLVRQNNSNESLLKIYAITQVLTIVLVCGAAYVVYAFAEETTLLYEAYIVDMVPLNSAVLVLIKQFLPDSIFLETPLGRIKYTHTPLLVVLLSSLLSVLGVIRPVVILQCLLAVQISWTYLRFFNPHESDSFYGDSIFFHEPFNHAAQFWDVFSSGALRNLGFAKDRQKALRDLNERLNRTKRMETIAWEEDIEDETNEQAVKQDTVEETLEQVMLML